MPQSEEIIRSKILLKSLEKTIKEGPWDESVYLSNIGKKLKEYHYRIKEALQALETSDHTQPSKTSDLAHRIAQRAGQTEVFISLYNAQGNDLAKWAKLLMGLQAQAVSRPIYADEDDVRALVRSKVHKQSEAYVVVYVDKDKIIPLAEDVLPRDKLGHVLLTLKDGAVKPQQVVSFMHASGRYVFKDNKLVRIGDIEYLDFR
jgi:intracellular multiplication protein IcmQ